MSLIAVHHHTHDCCSDAAPVVDVVSRPVAVEVRDSWLDRVGMGVGLICAVHCLAMPVLIGVLPLVGLTFVAEEPFEWAVVGLVAILAIASALWGYQKHKVLRVLMSFAGALGLMGLGLWNAHNTFWGDGLVILGGLAVAATHLMSARLCRQCTVDACCD